MKKNVIITISEDHLDRINSVVNLLSQDGLVIENVFEFGIITGVVDENKIEKLKKHQEILTLTDDVSQKISPPENEIQ
ncbi:hypothetical protein [Flavivirga spongiicola]|uniref:Ketohydroxyglutarate aldolase n=1 Tax=Flavivirga spongiicola TaxID=421621 RepID=A0ABU7XW58_9FLAO|nr:hypothetical protein [Flavivirga sp. MEBiC05379]MDO5979992.1 hypothetical protein [Flavivirga sp. MEBiC05379]